VRLNEPLPPSSVTYPKCRTQKGSNSTCLRVLFLTRSPKPAVRQVSRCCLSARMQNALAHRFQAVLSLRQGHCVQHAAPLHAASKAPQTGT